MQTPEMSNNDNNSLHPENYLLSTQLHHSSDIYPIFDVSNMYFSEPHRVAPLKYQYSVITTRNIQFKD